MKILIKRRLTWPGSTTLSVQIGGNDETYAATTMKPKGGSLCGGRHELIPSPSASNPLLPPGPFDYPRCTHPRGAGGFLHTNEQKGGRTA